MNPNKKSFQRIHLSC